MVDGKMRYRGRKIKREEPVTGSLERYMKFMRCMRFNWNYGIFVEWSPRDFYTLYINEVGNRITKWLEE